MSKAPRLSVAMATFNGARYISEQLQSLASQRFLPFELVVCDDGSTDGTLDIIKSFQSGAPFPVRLFQNEKNLGYADNFLKAASLSQGDWIAFCDQDDVWHNSKLLAAAKAIESYPSAVLILQNSHLCDSSLRSTGRLFPNAARPGYYKKRSQYGFWVWLGFLQTVSRTLFDEFQTVNRPINYYPEHVVQSHDKWTCMIANAIGGIVVNGDAVASYRRHASALTGTYADQTPADRIAKALNVRAEHYAFLSNAASSSADYLRRAASNCRNDIWRSDLTIAAQNFDTIEAIMLLRFQLYTATSFFSRVITLSKIIAAGGYWGRRMTAMGTMSAAKDFAAALGFVNYMQNRR